MNGDNNSIYRAFGLDEEREKIARSLAQEGIMWEPAEEIPDWLRDRMPDDSNMEEKMDAVYSGVPRENWPGQWRLLEYINMTRMYWVDEWKKGRVQEGDRIRSD